MTYIALLLVNIIISRILIVKMPLGQCLLGEKKILHESICAIYKTYGVLELPRSMGISSTRLT